MLRARRHQQSLVGRAAGPVVTLALLVGCGDGGGETAIDGDAPTTEAPTESPAPTTSTTSTASELTTTSIPTEMTATSAPPGGRAELEAEDVTWDLTARAHRDAPGRQVAFDCPTGGEPRPIWGTAVYTDDSSVCTAAVHAGVIGLDGGRVVIEIVPGQGSYDGSEANGVTSADRGRWDASYLFP